MQPTVNSMPKLPSNENGANTVNFLTLQSGQRATIVINSRQFVLVHSIPAVFSNALVVSANIMLYATPLGSQRELRYPILRRP
mmetsp:Transcript_11331/g.25420  ORF Transcript_11331/g.25420 Transcript_11331/m.25420 type:complete len:83 (-) Transcript_11331:462-710(-)